MTSAPRPILAGIAAAWAVAIAAQVAGAAALVHHDALLVDGPPLGVALVAFLLSFTFLSISNRRSS